MFCHTGLGHYGHHPDPGEVDLPPETQPTPPSATLVGTTITHLRDSDHHSTGVDSLKIDRVFARYRFHSIGSLYIVFRFNFMSRIHCTL